MMENPGSTLKPNHLLVLKAGMLLHKYGTPSHRLERVLTKVSADLGLQGVFLYTPTGLLVSLVDADGERTYLRRVEGGDMHVDRLIRLDDILDNLSDGKLTIEQANTALDRLDQSSPTYPSIVFQIACTVASALVAILFGGSLPEICSAALIGSLISLLQVVHERQGWQVGSLEPLCGLIASVGALIVAQAGGPAMAYLGFFILGIGASVLAPTAFSVVGQYSAPEARARAVARATLLGYFGYFVGPPLLGLIAGTFGLRFAFLFAACLVGLVFLLAPVLARQRT
jgi:uncharacterized membrane protein YjjP (DUF1212 family)